MDDGLFPRVADYSNTRFPKPWPHQERAHQALRDGMRQLLAQRKRCRQLLVAPTGSGKTVMGLRIIHEALQKGRRGVFVCDRTALINQTSARADEYGLTDHAIVQADHWRRDNSMPFQIASIQTIQARGFWPKADVVVIDEAHTQYGAIKEYLERTDAAVIGLTATPCATGLGRYYDNMVNAATMHELTEAGVLVPLRILSCTKPDMKGAATTGGEWTKEAAAEREAKIIGDVVAEWETHGEGRKTIAFGATISYCEDLMRRFNDAGIHAELFTSETHGGERDELLKEFSKPDSGIRILISVDALAKGFDVQDIGCVIDARPLRKSLSTAIQMWGRGLRSSKETGKQDCILLDHSGNIVRFLQDFEAVFHNGFTSLNTAEKLDKSIRKDEDDYEPKGCPSCGHKPFSKRCMSCGFEKESMPLVDESPGVMREVRIGKSVAAASKADLWNQICTWGKMNVRSEKRAGWAWHKYQEITGETVPRSFPKFEDAPIVAVSPATAGKLRSLRIAYNKRRKAA